jgi:hypothetical protein
MIKLVPFKSLSKAQKYKYLTEKGEYIGVREYSNYFINLYLIEDIFYELWFFRPTHMVARIEVLKDQKKLDLYINHMNKPDVKMVTSLF